MRMTASAMMLAVLVSIKVLFVISIGSLMWTASAHPMVQRMVAFECPRSDLDSTQAGGVGECNAAEMHHHLPFRPRSVCGDAQIVQWRAECPTTSPSHKRTELEWWSDITAGDCSYACHQRKDLLWCIHFPDYSRLRSTPFGMYKTAWLTLSFCKAKAFAEVLCVACSGIRS